MSKLESSAKPLLVAIFGAKPAKFSFITKLDSLHKAFFEM
jgi:hypothetical protein